MENKPLAWAAEIANEYAKKGDTEAIKNFLKEVRNMLKTVAVASAEKGDMKLISMFTPWKVRESIEIIEAAVLANNLELCKSLAYERWRANIMGIFAARRGTVEVVEIALESGADEIDRIARIAAEIGRADIIKLFMSRGYKNTSPLLILAERGGHHDVVLAILG